MMVKLYTQKNDYWAPDGDQTRNLLMTGETLKPLTYQDSDGELRCKFVIYQKVAGSIPFGVEKSFFWV